MGLPFTEEQFLDVFAQYNTNLWPLLAILFICTIISVVLVWQGAKKKEAFSLIVLSALWALMGLGYHIFFFRQINPVAVFFGIAFLLQALFFLWALWKQKISFTKPEGLRLWLGGFFILFGLVLYPLIGLLFGQAIPRMPLFGAPCPTVIFTFGLLLWTERMPRALLIIPFLWALLGFYAAVALGIYQDIMLLIAGLTAAVILLKPK